MGYPAEIAVAPCNAPIHFLSAHDGPWFEEAVARMSGDASLVLGLCFDSRTAAMLDVAQMAVQTLSTAGHVEPPFSEDLRLILTELIANAHLHGNLRGMAPGDAPEWALNLGIALHVRRQGGEMTLMIANAPPITGTVWPAERGLGLTIIESLGGKIAHSPDLSRWTVRLSLG